jgi:hypothetical protein
VHGGAVSNPGYAAAPRLALYFASSVYLLLDAVRYDARSTKWRLEKGYSMKRRSVQYIIMAIGFLFASALCAETSNHQLKRILESRYAEMKAAMAARNEPSIRGLLAPSFVSIDSNGNSENADQMIKELIATPQDPNKKSKTTIISVERNGNAVTVVQQYYMTSIRKPADASTLQTIEIIARSTDTWQLICGVWLYERTATDELQYSVDGKAAIHKKRLSVKQVGI